MQTKAIIIKKQNTNEYDQWVTCYTEEFGKLTAIAKSILKPSSVQAMHLDVFNLVSFELVNGRGMPIIAGAQTEKSFLNLKNSLQLLSVASFFTEVFDKMIFDMERDGKLWDFTVDLLEKLDKAVRPNNALIFFRQKQFQLLGLLGYAPQTQAAVSLTNIYKPFKSQIDSEFEYVSGLRFNSLDFLYSVVK